MAYTTRSTYKLSHNHNFFSSKTFEDRGYRSKSANPPSSLIPLYSTPISVVRQRQVLPFSIQSQQKHTVVVKGPLYESSETTNKRGKSKTIKFSVHNDGSSSHRSKSFHRSNSFRMYFDRGDLPIKMEYLCGGDKIGWTVTYRQGVSDLLIAGGEKVPAVIPQLILPLKNALSTKNLEVMCTTLKIIQQLVLSSDLVGPALVPFYRQLLPMFNAYKVKNLNCGDEIDYTQKKNMNLGDLIDETLQILEIHGGEDAFINIKYMVPTYESCYLN
ncbi:parkin coregulated gene protein homolog isoform X4 [Lucilia cuprina]|uniref:parkin coregulated gene protein homolog isoform X4 n=1 Tax=Lucilia cuprina TaxID=7375 RepID=UPI001F06807B|nr:parkin coregulated gene protein homolog isoform X4 [Lucilia cuprina]